MCGLFEWLKLAWKAGFRKVVVESDSQAIVIMLIKNTPSNHPLFSIIQCSKSLIDDDLICIIQHVYRENNRVVDSLANLRHYMDLGVTFFEDPPA